MAAELKTENVTFIDGIGFAPSVTLARIAKTLVGSCFQPMQSTTAGFGFPETVIDAEPPPPVTWIVTSVLHGTNAFAVATPVAAVVAIAVTALLPFCEIANAIGIPAGAFAPPAIQSPSVCTDTEAANT
ncbi:MAG: hypothetical protein ACREBE_17875 [bacterium]